MGTWPAIKEFFLEPLSGTGPLRKWIITVFVVVNGIVLANACLHHPGVGYDAGDHLAYISTLAQGRLPGPNDSNEFFSPPLPYVVPALFGGLTGAHVAVAGKIGQLMNVVLSVGLTFLLLRTCHLFSRNDAVKLGALVFLGILPVYYKTFAFVRGEPYVAFFAVLVLYLVTATLVKSRFGVGAGVGLGLAMGACVLSRQWGVALCAAVVLFAGYQFIRCPSLRRPIARCMTICLPLSALVGGWFYVSLKARHGKFTAFNRQPIPVSSFPDRAAEFRIRLSPGLLFSNPIRPAFRLQLLPILYSETWGDYHCYFVVYGVDKRQPRFSQYVSGKHLADAVNKEGRPDWLDTNYDRVGGYLGRVNLVSLFPSFLALASVGFAVRDLFPKARASLTDDRRSHKAADDMLLFALMAVVFSFCIYGWFLIMYGPYVKATYVLHVFPFVALLVGHLLVVIAAKSHLAAGLILAFLVLVFVHNLPAVVTHYSLLRVL